MPSVEQLTITKLLGIYISVIVTAAAHVEHILSVANQRMYLFAQLMSQDLRSASNALHIILSRNVFWCF